MSPYTNTKIISIILANNISIYQICLSMQTDMLMKTIESTLVGQKFITARNKAVRLFQVKQILNQHRDLLIDKLINDIPYYLAFKYHARANDNELAQIKSKLIDLQKRDLDLTNYASIVEEIKRKSLVKLNNQEFYKEIDQLLLG